MRLLPIILLLSLGASAQPGGYVAGTQVCWQYNSRDHGFFRASGWDEDVDHILIFFGGDGQTTCANYDGMQPGLFLRDGAGGSNWNGVTNLPAEAGGGSRKWMVLIMTNHGNQPDVYAADITFFLNNVGITVDASWSDRIHYGGGSGGPGRANAFFNNSTSNPYRTFHSTGIWMSTTLYTVSANSPAKNYCWYGDDDNNAGTPPSFTINVYNQLPGVEDVDKFLGITVGGDHDNGTWGDCFEISGTTYEDNRWIWMIVEGEDLIEDPVYPPPALIGLSTQRLYDLVQANKPTYRLVDGDTVAHVYPDCFEGYIINEFKTQGIWIDLDTFITNPKIEVYHDGNGGGTFSVQYYYGYQDTSRHSELFSTTLPSSAWKGVDTTNSRAYADSARFVKVIINDCVHHVTEIRVYGVKCGKAPPITPPYASPPADPGKRFMYYGKVFTDTLMDDAGWGQRIQNSMDYIDTATVTFTDGKAIVFNRFGNSTNFTLLPSKRMGLDIMMYFANLRDAFKYDPLDAQSKDMPIGADSLDEASWIPVYNTHYGIAAKFGNNPSANVTGYTFGNTNAGIGQNLIKEMEIGNEDIQHWNGSRRFHDPYVQLLKIKAGFEGVRDADNAMPVISGALTGLRFDRTRAMYFANLWMFGSKSYPCDAIALNEYSTTAGGQAQGGSYQGTTPEQFSLKKKLDSLRTIRDSLFPGRGLYITEFGYDAANYTEDDVNLDTVDHESNYNVPDIAGQTRDQTKSYWTMRWYEIGAAARMDRMVQYSQRDIAGSDFATTGYSYTINLPFPGNTLPSYLHQFMSSGILSGGGFTSLPKELYWHMTCRRYRLQNYNAWPTVIAEGDSTGVWALRYTHISNADSLIYSVWKGTHSNSTTSNYVVNIPNVATATLVTPAIGDKDGTTSVLSIAGNNVTVPTVNEGVQYILVTLDDSPAGPSTIRNWFRGSLRNRFRNL